MCLPGSLLDVIEFHHTPEQLCSLVALTAPPGLVPVLANIQVTYQESNVLIRVKFYQTKES